ncbi:PREDICTED: uncharacterized protein LOC109216905 [Nicotiana attenuata]|uniref:uncharacterized protein LOC109216905 n=1 Tax=Nicotiana attenuata TaxID=49451 RepID=UPI000904DDB4|nr:PREDICTED: uncharacterized protein LOC109216905 [Nicotiana attenuata]
MTPGLRFSQCTHFPVISGLYFVLPELESRGSVESLKSSSPISTVINYLKLWSSAEPINLIDLGHAFFLIKFVNEDNMLHALHNGPWFVLAHFLTVRRWEPKFVASTAQLAYSAIWAHFPELPMEYYDLELLKLVGNKLGQLLKFDTCTSTTTRGCYARICIEIPLAKPLKTHVYIGTHNKIVVYEGLNILCLRCGRIGHNTKSCPSHILTAETPTPSSPLPPSIAANNALPSQTTTLETPWQTVKFSTRS